ncbi:MAG: collagen-like protein [Actinobacteria bacterium]|nr:collagen-like protein [Actinomycetota bacterium]
MKHLSSKLTYANVVASLALFIALAGGTAFAASQLEKESVGTSQLKKEAVTPSKLSKKSKATLTGPQGPQGPKGDTGAPGPRGDRGEAGAAGSAVAYARIEANGTLDAAASMNVASASLSSVTGVYCITPSVPVHSIEVTTPHVGGDASTLTQGNIAANGDSVTLACTTPVWVSIRNGGGTLENHPFYVVFN